MSLEVFLYSLLLRQHLYINNMCPPEYAELEGGNSNGSTSFRNLNHTAPWPCYASTSVLDSQYPLPPLPKTTSSEEGAHTGETSSGDSSSGAASAESRGRRSRSRASGSNSGSDSSGRGTTDTSRLGGGAVHQQQVETRIIIIIITSRWRPGSSSSSSSLGQSRPTGGKA